MSDQVRLCRTSRDYHTDALSVALAGCGIQQCPASLCEQCQSVLLLALARQARGSRAEPKGEM